MNKKYEILSDDTIEVNGHILHRIRALKTFRASSVMIVACGDLGGYIEKEDNLSHGSSCWVDGNARVYGDAKIYGDAVIYGTAEVYDNAQVYAESLVFERAIVCDSAKVSGESWVFGDAIVRGNFHITGAECVYAGVYE